MLYIFNPSEQLQAILKPDTSATYAQPTGDAYFVQPQNPTPDEAPQATSMACPYYDSVHTEKLAGENTFTFTVPASHLDSQYITEGNLVAFKDLDANWQLFEIKRVTDTHGDGLIRTAYCEHAFYELIDDLIEDLRPANCSASFALAQALTGTRWQSGTVSDLGLNSTNYYYESALSSIQKVATVWKGELQFRVLVTGGVISARYVDLLTQRGSNTGKQFAYSKDIDSIEREVDLTETKTALYGRGKGVEVKEGYGRRLTFADVVWTSPPDPVDKPSGQEWVGDPAALAQWGRPGGRHRFGVFEDDEETDAANLLQKTWDALQERKNPRVTYRLDVADLERLSGYEHEKVRLGDTVRVIDRAFSPVLLVEARVIEINRDLLRPENTRITLYNFAPDLAAEALKQQQVNQTVRDRQGVWDRSTVFDPTTGKLGTTWLDGIINTLNNEVMAGNGSVTLTDNNGILIVDNPTTPTKALRLLGGLLAISNEKDPVTGEWIWRTFGTGDGFTADEVTTGTMVFDRISGGTATLGGAGNGNGVLSIKDASGVEHVRGDNTGITVKQANFIIQDDTNQVPTIIDFPNNMVFDHSFELIPRTGSVDGDQTFATPSQIDEYFIWGTTASPRVLSTLNTDAWQMALFDNQAICVNSTNYVKQICQLDYRAGLTGPYTLSAWTAVYKTLTANPTAVIRLEAINDLETILQSYQATLTLDYTQLYVWKRFSLTVQNLPTGTTMIRVVLRTTDAQWVAFDGVQLVPRVKPALYNPESSLFRFMQGLKGYIMQSVDVNGPIYAGGQVNIEQGGAALRMGPGTSDHVFLEFYADTQSPSTRSGFMGFPTAGSSVLDITNGMAGTTLRLDSNKTLKFYNGTTWTTIAS